VLIPIDGSVADIGTLLAGCCAMLVKPVKRRFKKAGPCFVSRDLIVDFLNGATVPSFVLLVGSVISSRILEEALKSGKVSMALAGFIGLIFITREIITG
jgi:hypothetical protein